MSGRTAAELIKIFTSYMSLKGDDRVAILVNSLGVAILVRPKIDLMVTFA